MKLKGIYLVIDPSMEREQLLEKTAEALENGVQILQIWNHWSENTNREEKEVLVDSILGLANDYETPVLINEEWSLLKTTGLHGVHFESIPENFEEIRGEIGREFMCGITCSNDLEVIHWAEENELDYISFCAMFPSPSVESCPIVRPETVKKAREITSLPIFVSGGITPGNLEQLNSLDFDGVAVISGILKSEKPGEATSAFQKALQKRTKSSSS